MNTCEHWCIRDLNPRLNILHGVLWPHGRLGQETVQLIPVDTRVRHMLRLRRDLSHLYSSADRAVVRYFCRHYPVHGKPLIAVLLQADVRPFQLQIPGQLVPVDHRQGYISAMRPQRLVVHVVVKRRQADAGEGRCFGY